MLEVEGFLNYNAGWKLPDVYFFTANSVVTKAGELVMGAGSALAAKEAFPASPKAFADKLSVYPTNIFGVEFVCVGKDQWLGAFQTKTNWKSGSTEAVIQYSTNVLSSIMGLRPHVKFHIPFPGICFGRLKKSDVLPIIGKLSDNAIFYS